MPLAEAIDRYAASFDAVMAAYKLPQGSPEEQQRREAAIQTALQGAASVPLGVARRAADIFDRLGQLEPMASPSMKSDLRVGRLMAAAAVLGALENVAINLEGEQETALVPFAWITEAKLVLNDALMKRGAEQREARLQSETEAENAPDGANLE